MAIHTLTKTTKKPLRRVGRGYGSTRAKTSGRGTKGQKARSKVSLWFEGGALPLIKRLPKSRGMGRNKSLKPDAIGINVERLEVLPAKTVVDAESLVKYNIIPASILKSKRPIKILGNGELTKALSVKVTVSKGAREKIESAGGSII